MGRCGVIPPEEYFNSFELLLTGEARNWLQFSAEAVSLFNLHYPTENHLKKFLQIFKDRFPTKAPKTTHSTLNAELEKLQQSPEETIMHYHRRTATVLTKYGGRESIRRWARISPEEESILSAVLDKFIDGLIDQEIRFEVQKLRMNGEQSLTQLSSLAEGIEMANREGRLYRERIAKDREIEKLSDSANRISLPTRDKIRDGMTGEDSLCFCKNHDIRHQFVVAEHRSRY